MHEIVTMEVVNGRNNLTTNPSTLFAARPNLVIKLEQISMLGFLQHQHITRTL